MANGFDIWGVVASVLGLVSLFQLIAVAANSRLPRQWLRTFDVALGETETFLRSVEEEGLFDDDDEYMATSKTAVVNVCNRIRRLREDAFTAQTLRQEIRQWWKGLSKDIAVCCDDLKDLLCQVSSMSIERREELARRQREPSSLPAECAQPDTPSSLETSSYIAYGLTSEPQHLVIEETKDLPSTKDDQAHLTNATLLPVIPSTSRAPSELDDPLPSYRRQSSLPPYTLSNPLSSTIFTRYSVTSADTRRAMRNLVRAQRRNLMVHNVPWSSQGAPHPQRGPSAAGSAMAAHRPSNAARPWKFLEARSKSRLLAYATASSHEATRVPSPHVAGTAVV